MADDDELGKDEHLRRDGGDDDQRYEERDGDLPVEPAEPADDQDEVPPGTEPGAET